MNNEIKEVKVLLKGKTCNVCNYYRISRIQNCGHNFCSWMNRPIGEICEHFNETKPDAYWPNY
jgi:hypothetical protein